MEDKYEVLKNVYNNYKTLVKGTFEYLEDNKEMGPYISWKVDDNISAYIDCSSIMTTRGSNQIDYETFDENNYQQIYDIITKYDGEFRRNPDYGKKEINLEKRLIYFTIIVSIAIIIFVCILNSK